MRRHTLPFVGILSVTAIALTGCSTADSTAASSTDDNVITFATAAVSDDPTAINPAIALAELYAAETGYEVEVVDVPDYLAVVEATRNGHVDFGLMSGFPSALAVNTGEIDPIVAFEADDSPVATCVVLPDSGIATLEDFRGKTVAFADQGSSSGFFMPNYMLHEAGLEREEDYDAIFSGSHDASFIALQEGQVDAACTAFQLIEMGEPVFPFAEGEYETVGESPSMPISMTIFSGLDLDADKREAIQNATPQVFSEENAETLDSYGSVIGLNIVNDPDKAMFQEFVEIAAVADVQLEDLG